MCWAGDSGQVGSNSKRTSRSAEQGEVGDAPQRRGRSEEQTRRPIRCPRGSNHRLEGRQAGRQGGIPATGARALPGETRHLYLLPWELRTTQSCTSVSEGAVGRVGAGGTRLRTEQVSGPQSLPRSLITLAQLGIRKRGRACLRGERGVEFSLPRVLETSVLLSSFEMSPVQLLHT